MAADISPDGDMPEREYSEVVLKNRVQKAIAKINPTIPYEAQEEALRKVLRSDSPNLFQNNYHLSQIPDRRRRSRIPQRRPYSG
jgi:type I restriction enzyme R subunit